jgi:uncharacterized protein (DUF302 family)
MVIIPVDWFGQNLLYAGVEWILSTRALSKPSVFATVRPLNKTGTMTLKELFFLLFIFSVSVTADEEVKPLETANALVYKIEGEFNDVKEDLVRAIEEQGAVISYTAHADAMLKRTGKDLGIKKQVYRQAEILLFCKAEISHNLVQADPHSLILCPYPIAVYTLTSDAKNVYLSISKPVKEPAEYRRIHRLLQTIVQNVITF